GGPTSPGVPGASFVFSHNTPPILLVLPQYTICLTYLKNEEHISICSSFILLTKSLNYVVCVLITNSQDPCNLPSALTLPVKCYNRLALARVRRLLPLFTLHRDLHPQLLTPWIVRHFLPLSYEYERLFIFYCSYSY